MNHVQLNGFLKTAYRLNIPVSIWSESGSGKTDAVRKLALDENCNLVELHLASQETGDLLGLPERIGNQTTFLKPHWFPTDNKTIIFLDEWNRANKYVLRMIFPFLLDGRLGPHQLPKGCWVVAAANPESDDYDVTSIIDKAMISRLCHVALSISAEEWIKHARINDVDKSLINVIKKDPRLLDKVVNKGFDPCPKSEPRPRNLTKLGQWLNKIQDNEWNLFGLEFAKGVVGHELAMLYFKEREAVLKGDISPEDIMDRYEETLPKIKIICDPSNIVMSEIDRVLSQVHGKILNKELKHITREQMINIAKFTMECPHDKTKTFWLDLIEVMDHEEEKQTPEVKDFYEKVYMNIRGYQPLLEFLISSIESGAEKLVEGLDKKDE